MSIILRVNEKVKTPNGVGVIQGRLLSRGHLKYMVRHVVKDMTSTSFGTTITPRAAQGNPKYPTGVWIYYASEVERA